MTSTCFNVIQRIYLNLSKLFNDLQNNKRLTSITGENIKDDLTRIIDYVDTNRGQGIEPDCNRHLTNIHSQLSSLKEKITPLPISNSPRANAKTDYVIRQKIIDILEYNIIGYVERAMKYWSTFGPPPSNVAFGSKKAKKIKKAKKSKKNKKKQKKQKKVKK